MLVFNNVSRVYADGTVAVDCVNLQLSKGEFCVLLGPSGAGKTTLMNMANGVVEPTSGSIHIDETPLTPKNLTQVRQQIGMIHQQLHLVPRLNVLHNVLAGQLHKTAFLPSLIKAFPLKEKRRACQLLAEVGLEEKHLYRRASELSGGQQQRVAIARAFINNPPVVLADEPVASLDPVMSRSVLESLRTAAKKHQTTVLCTLHQLEYALEFADRIVALRQGKIAFDGTPKDFNQTIIDQIYVNQALEEQVA